MSLAFPLQIGVGLLTFAGSLGLVVHALSDWTPGFANTLESSRAPSRLSAPRRRRCADMAENDSGEKTEEPTGKRRRGSAREGPDRQEPRAHHGRLPLRLHASRSPSPARRSGASCSTRWDRARHVVNAERAGVSAIPWLQTLGLPHHRRDDRLRRRDGRDRDRRAGGADRWHRHHEGARARTSSASIR